MLTARWPLVQTAPLTNQELAAVSGRLDEFLGDLLAPLGRSERQPWATIYLHGLLLDGDRKAIAPMANRMEGADLPSLRQFVGQSPWAVEEGQPLLAEKMVDLRTEPEVWLIAETSFPKRAPPRLAGPANTAARWAKWPIVRWPSVCTGAGPR